MNKKIFKFGCLGSVILGIGGFLIGFIGPIIFMPSSNQGPLIGIFITGPGGAMFGGLLGSVYGYFKK